MKILLATLALGLVCAHHQPPSEDTCAQISGSWRTIYIGSNNTEAISENSPFRGYFRRVECLDEGQLSATFYSKENDQCQLHNKTARRTEQGSYTTDYHGPVEFKFHHVSDDLVVTCVLSKSEEGQSLRVIVALARGNDLSEENYKTFLDLVKEKGIPEENVFKVIDTDTCPQETD